jgi:hypothetical protein
MGRTFRVLEEAVEEFERALSTMEHRSAADHLGLSVLAALERVEAAPLAYPVFDPQSGLRRHVLPDLMRYAVIYATNERRTVVVAIADGRREPNYWRARVPDE